MAIAELTIIGESINDSVPSTKKLFEANDIEGLAFGHLADPPHRDSDSSGHVLPRGLSQAHRCGAVSRDPEAEHMSSFGVKVLAEAAQAVR